jgi:hypothetical protein
VEKYMTGTVDAAQAVPENSALSIEDIRKMYQEKP